MVATSPAFTTGKAIIPIVNLVTSVGLFLTAWNETHIFNPNWPPHARYHNGQTMSTGLFIGLITFFVLFAHMSFTPSLRKQKLHLTWIVVLQSLIYLGSLADILYPSAGWTNPEFGAGKPQAYLFPVLVSLTWMGWWVKTSRLDRVAGVTKRA